MTTVRYLPWQELFAIFPRLVEDTLTTGVSVCDIGGGANPRLGPDIVRERHLNYLVLDISQDELDKTPPEYRTLCADIGDPDLRLPQQFDLVLSHTLLEHVQNADVVHRNVHRLLRPGGRALHFFPTFHTLPFLANRLLPSGPGEWLLSKVQRGRSADGNHAKFPAFYSWCRGPVAGQIQRFTELGYEVETYLGAFGHGYYRRLPLLDRCESVKQRTLLRHPHPSLTSYALVCLRRPPVGPEEDRLATEADRVTDREQIPSLASRA